MCNYLAQWCVNYSELITQNSELNSELGSLFNIKYEELAI